ncbi:myeloid leukemia factor isoform X3 [Vespula maculifrons]|uniref:Myeloid leukemia factor isoform X3 n=1 Tax=Vespula maculifrons TaxID=7453 RepID=A0ABD2AM91_VESMC
MFHGYSYNSSRWIPSSRRNIKALSSKTYDLASTSRSDPLPSSEATYHRKATTGYRKREHTPDTEYKHKRPAM